MDITIKKIKTLTCEYSMLQSMTTTTINTPLLRLMDDSPVRLVAMGSSDTDIRQIAG